ncbi:hypothetical protein [Actinomycetospora chibensis]|jgi:hypothetical protein|uniref:Uncharacterized protein n=1 Tax=Actinomycetospora chibensis TaxID=663606 RepID=A0ABV9RAV5_9PSEU|nr:hypothetical protein [Actinomycetospora chibensis]MDD7922186.1 hypothetical protein [Actinomycetospora chibensis]
METTPHRRITEAWELVAHAVDLRRRGVPHVTLLAALDQARRSLHHEPCRDARRTLIWVAGALEHGDAGPDTDARVDAALRVAAHDLARSSSGGDAR